MTPKEAKAGIRKWLRGDGGLEISIDWFTRSGEVGREVLFEMLDAPSVSLKAQMNIQQLLLTLFYSTEVEHRLLARAASSQDPRIRSMQEGTVRRLTEGRHALRTMLEQVDATMRQKKPNKAPEPTRGLVTDRAGARSAPNPRVAHL